MESITLLAAIIAITKQIKESFPFVNGFATMLVAIVLGGLAGYFKIEGIDIYHGVLLGISACGAHTLASAIGQSERSVPEVSGKPLV